MNRTQELHSRLPGSREGLITAVDTHTAGELTRVVLSGGPELPSLTVEELRTHFREHHDQWRKRIAWEPRGHRDLVVAWIVAPHHPEAQSGVIFMDAQRYLLACGTATVGAVTALVEMGLVVPKEGVVVLETPSGLVRCRVFVKGERVEQVALDMVPACLTQRRRLLSFDARTYAVDLGFVGGFLLLVDSRQLGFSVTPENRDKILDLGDALTQVANEELEVIHPRTGLPSTVDGVLFYDPAGHSLGIGYGTVVYGARHLDRSPCGTGTALKVALLHADGELELGQALLNRGILGTEFVGSLIEEITVGEFSGVRVRLEASASIVSFHEFFLTEGDPLAGGFLL